MCEETELLWSSGLLKEWDSQYRLQVPRSDCMKEGSGVSWWEGGGMCAWQRQQCLRAPGAELPTPASGGGALLAQAEFLAMGSPPHPVPSAILPSLSLSF